MQSIKAIILSLGVMSGLAACMPNGFLISRPNAATAQQTVSIDPITQSNDRPTETGAGVPGYLVNCSDITDDDDLVQVGCSVATSDGKQVPSTDSSWTRYEVKLAASANPSIRITKSIADADEPWAVIFEFTGAPLAELRLAAQSSTYTYSESDDKGATVTVESPPPVTPKTTAPAVNQTCPDGVLVEGICMVTVAMSCKDYCSQSQMKVHPWVVDRYGTGASGNRKACSDLYDKFPDRLSVSVDLGINEVTTLRGLGCHRSAGSLTYFDATPTDPAAKPFLGYTRICACQ